MKNELCAVLISSCDKYEDAWFPFFYFLKKNWESCPYPLYLSTESKVYVDEKLSVKMLHCRQRNVSWSVRLKNALKSISTEYIIFLLEDFFLTDKVNQNEIERCIGYMEKNRRISVIDFECAEKIPTRESQYPGYVERLPKAMYFLNCQASIWRRKDLIRFLNPYENPWQFELFGSERAKLFNRMFLLQEQNAIPVFPYNVNWTTGYGIHGGKWLKSNILLFEREGIHVDFNRMGFYEHKAVQTSCVEPRVNFKWKVMYFLYGGYGQSRMTIREQLKCCFMNPRRALFALKQKIIFIMCN